MTKILIIQADFYKQIARDLCEGAQTILDEEHAEYEVISVPGCFEIPAALSMAIASEKYSGFIALGCVIRGETTHYDYVCSECARGINQLAMQHKVAVGFGIITAENKEQALERANPGGKKNMGANAAKACLTMLNIKKEYNAT